MPFIKDRNWNEIAKDYDKIIKNEGDIKKIFLCDKQILYELKQERTKIENKIILDAGCGNGYWLKKISLFKPKFIIAFDNSNEMLKIARERNINNQYLIKFFKHSLNNKITLDNSSVDFILCTLVLDYVRNLKKAIKEFYRILKRNGMVLITIQHPFFHIMKKNWINQK